MKNALSVIVVCLLLVAVMRANAAEVYLGTVANADAGTGVNVPSNLTTATPFTIPPNSLITVQPSAAAYVCVDFASQYDAGSTLVDGGPGPWSQYLVPSCSSTLGVKVAADTAFPSACAPARALQMPDGGVVSCAVSCVPVTGASVSCPVWTRSGKEF